ncbi:uncharacterized protein LOC121994968 [Zingiber officinale]|uniref:uncharacterized protein LOC121994968 n=1 Tax=Zingiber officinale TaxID=94328 RepID=UPI001C4AC2FF|nr:uncharacterized protein LOC121994968 [Zingiber officinale]
MTILLVSEYDSSSNVGFCVFGISILFDYGFSSLGCKPWFPSTAAVSTARRIALPRAAHPTTSLPVHDAHSLPPPVSQRLPSSNFRSCCTATVYTLSPLEEESLMPKPHSRSHHWLALDADNCCLRVNSSRQLLSTSPLHEPSLSASSKAGATCRCPLPRKRRERI